MPSLLRIPKVQLALVLFVIFLTTLTSYPLLPILSLLLICLVLTVSFDLFFLYLKLRRVFVPHAAVVTGLIISLLVNPAAPWYYIAAVAAVAMATKNFLRVWGRHVFNPAAMGLFAAGIILREPVAWWGTSFQSVAQPTIQNILTLPALFLPVFVSGFRLRRHLSILAFLALYSIIPFVMTAGISLSSIVVRLLNPTVIFFATVMLPEPMTSPSHPKRQVAFGAIVAIFVGMLSYPPLTTALASMNLLPDIFIPALLLGNLLFFKLK